MLSGGASGTAGSLGFRDEPGGMAIRNYADEERQGNPIDQPMGTGNAKRQDIGKAPRNGPASIPHPPNGTGPSAR